jgi:HD-GYP domain-containing protein (c-di-GMP phosphodiesterase class II)
MLKKIAVEQVTLGMHIHEFCGSWMDHPFWREKFVLTDQKDLYLIQHGSIKEVWIDIKKGLDVQGQTREEVASTVDSELEEIADEAQAPEPPAEPPPAKEKPQRPAPQRVSMAAEVERAAQICATSKEAVVSMFQEVRMGKAIDHAAASELVEEISDSVMRNPGALISLARLKTADDYTYMHSVAVCALMVALSRMLNLDENVDRKSVV